MMLLATTLSLVEGLLSFLSRLGNSEKCHSNHAEVAVCRTVVRAPQEMAYDLLPHGSSEDGNLTAATRTTGVCRFPVARRFTCVSGFIYVG